MKRFVIYILAALPAIGFSQTTLSIDDCIRLAKENNKQITAAEKQMQAYDYTLKSNKALFFPNISLTGSALYSTADGGYASGAGQLPVLDATGKPTGQTAYFPGLNLDYSLDRIVSGGIKLEQPLYMGGKIRAAYKMSKLGKDISFQNRRLTESEVVVETCEAFANVVRAKEMTKVATAYNNLLEELLRNVEKAKSHGMKSQNDVLKVKVKLDEGKLNLRRAENAHTLAMMNLCHYIGKPLSENIETDSVLPDFSTDKSKNEIFNRPEYIMLDKKSDIAKSQVTMARSEHLPNVGLMGQYSYVNGVDLNGSKLMNNWNFLVGVQVSIPLFDFGHRINKIRSAKAQYEQTLAEQDDTNEKMQLEVAQSINNLDEASLELELANSTVASAEENLRTSRLQYEKGVELLSDYLEAQTIWQQSRQTQIDAKGNCYLRWLQYQKATGQIN